MQGNGDFSVKNIRIIRADSIRTNKQNRNSTAGKQPTILRMGYTRIETEAGGRAQRDARVEPSYRGDRTRVDKPPMPRVYKAKGKEK